MDGLCRHRQGRAEADVAGLRRSNNPVLTTDKRTSTMSTKSENLDILRRFQSGVFDEGNLKLIDELFADDFVGHSAADPEDIHGPEQYKEFVRMVRSASSDMQVSVEDRLAEGDRVAQRVIAKGTHDGNFMGIPPTGNEFEIGGIDIYRIEDGKIAEGWEQADMMGLMQQIGAIEAP